MSQTLEQKRAALALNAVAKAESAKDFSIVCKKTAARILTSGLAPTVAFALTRSSKARADEHGLLLDAFARHFQCKSAEELLKNLIEKDADNLRRKTEEAMALLVWLGRLAEGKYKRENPNDEDDGGLIR